MFDVTDPRYAGGAKGDGVTDDTAAIQAALTAAKAVGGVVWFPATANGYVLSATLDTGDLLGGSISFEGEGYKSQILAAQNIVAIKISDAFYPVVRGLRIVFPPADATGVAILLAGCFLAEIEKVQIYGVGGAGIRLQQATSYTNMLTIFCNVTGVAYDLQQGSGNILENFNFGVSGASTNFRAGIPAGTRDIPVANGSNFRAGNLVNLNYPGSSNAEQFTVVAANHDFVSVNSPTAFAHGNAEPVFAAAQPGCNGIQLPRNFSLDTLLISNGTVFGYDHGLDSSPAGAGIRNTDVFASNVTFDGCETNALYVGGAPTSDGSGGLSFFECHFGAVHGSAVLIAPGAPCSGMRFVGGQMPAAGRAGVEVQAAGTHDLWFVQVHLFNNSTVTPHAFAGFHFGAAVDRVHIIGCFCSGDNQNVGLFAAAGFTNSEIIGGDFAQNHFGPWTFADSFATLAANGVRIIGVGGAPQEFVAPLSVRGPLLQDGVENCIATAVPMVAGTCTWNFPRAFNAKPIVTFGVEGAPPSPGTTIYLTIAADHVTATSTNAADVRTVNFSAVGNPS